MEQLKIVALRAGLLAALLVSRAASQCPQLNSSYGITMGQGYSATVVADGLVRPRGLRFDSEGNLLVVERDTGIRVLKLNDDGCVASNKVLIPDSNLNHGIDLSADGKTLFVSGFDNAYAYSYDALAATATNKKIIINKMRNPGLHPSRTLLVSKFKPDILMLARGSNDNIDTSCVDINEGRCMIKMYNISELMNSSAPLEMAKTGKVLGWGLRNIVGFGEHPATGGIWSVENSMDEIKRQGKDVHNDNPAEKLNYHGILNDTKNPFLEANYGYPGCVPAWKPSDLDNPALTVGSQFVPNLATNLSIASSDAGCDKFQRPRLALPAHTAPIDIKFNKAGTAAYITFHGSWNRQPPDGFRVMKYEFGPDGQPALGETTSAVGELVLANTDNTPCPNKCIRPAGLAWAPNGKLYMAAEYSGHIFMINGAT